MKNIRRLIKRMTRYQIKLRARPSLVAQRTATSLGLRTRTLEGDWLPPPCRPLIQHFHWSPLPCTLSATKTSSASRVLRRPAKFSFCCIHPDVVIKRSLSRTGRASITWDAQRRATSLAFRTHTLERDWLRSLGRTPIQLFYWSFFPQTLSATFFKTNSFNTILKLFLNLDHMTSYLWFFWQIFLLHGPPFFFHSTPCSIDMMITK